MSEPAISSHKPLVPSREPLLCACPSGDCSRPPTQEDFLCDECRQSNSYVTAWGVDSTEVLGHWHMADNKIDFTTALAVSDVAATWT